MQRSAMIFFDLDGPILDVSAKYYRVYHDLLDEFGFPSLPRDQYWEAKRNKVSDESILRKTGAEEFVAQLSKSESCASKRIHIWLLIRFKREPVRFSKRCQEL